MNAVGIDVSSRKSTVAVLRPLGEVVCLPFDVTHDIAGLASLAEKLKAIDGETRVVMEHTGRYYEAVAKALHEAGFFVCAVNPLLIKEYGAKDPPHNCAQTIHIIPATQISRKSAIQAHYLHTK